MQCLASIKCSLFMITMRVHVFCIYSTVYELNTAYETICMCVYTLYLFFLGSGRIENLLTVEHIIDQFSSSLIVLTIEYY